VLAAGAPKQAQRRRADVALVDAVAVAVVVVVVVVVALAVALAVVAVDAGAWGSLAPVVVGVCAAAPNAAGVAVVVVVAAVVAIVTGVTDVPGEAVVGFEILVAVVVVVGVVAVGGVAAAVPAGPDAEADAAALAEGSHSKVEGAALCHVGLSLGQALVLLIQRASSNPETCHREPAARLL